MSYLIDIGRPLGERITDLRFRGAPIDPAQPFIVVTNNYRASGGGGFPGAGAAHAVLNAQDMNRDVLIEWVRQRKHLTRAQDASDRSWRFAPLQTAGAVTFLSASGKLDLAHAAGLNEVSLLRDNGDGMSTYQINLAPR